MYLVSANVVYIMLNQTLSDDFKHWEASDSYVACKHKVKEEMFTYCNLGQLNYTEIVLEK